MASTGRAPTGKVYTAQGNSLPPSFLDIGTNSGLTAHGIVTSHGNSAFTSISPSTTGYVLMSNGGSADPSFQPGGSSLINTLTGNSGGAISPSAGNINTIGSGSITIAGSGSTLTTQLTGLTNHAVLVGAGTSTITKLGVGTNGQVLIGASAADPAFATLTSSDSSISFTTGANTLSLQVAGGTTVGKTITGNSGGALSPTAGNWNIVGTGSTTASGSGSTLTVQLTGLTNHALQIGAGTATLTQLGAGTTGQILQTNTTADPTWSTATYPSTTTASQLLYSSATNVVGGLTSANNGLLVTSSAGVPSILAGPGTTGNILQSNAAAAPSFSTATYPSTATGTGTILRADGTNWVATTATYPATTTVSQILYSSSANVVGGISTANNSILSTDGSGVPSMGTSLSNDYTFTSSTAGATRTLTVSNTNNSNTASQALVQVTTGGGSAGDPFETFTVSGATSFSLGIDNSDSDAFVIAASTALGTTNVMHVSTAGEINYPLQPAFLAYLDAQKNDKTGAGAAYQLGTDALTEIFDQNSDFNTNGTFTAPVTGKYFLEGAATIVGCTNATNLNLKIVTSNRNYVRAEQHAAGSSNLNAIHAGLCDMDAADTAVVTVTVINEAGNTCDVFGSADVQTGFSGYLAC